MVSMGTIPTFDATKPTCEMNVGDYIATISRDTVKIKEDTIPKEKIEELLKSFD